MNTIDIVRVSIIEPSIYIYVELLEKLKSDDIKNVTKTEEKYQYYLVFDAIWEEYVV